jgi:beta-lactam-binding protein with PASTA domain
MPSGAVVAQTPEAGVACDSKMVELFVSSGPETRRIMPNLLGQDYNAVREFLENYGITVTIFKQEYNLKKHQDYTIGSIIAQKPLAGSWIDLKKPLLVQLVVLENN